MPALLGSFFLAETGRKYPVLTRRGPGRCCVGAQILVIAVLMKWVLARTFSVFQWEALLLLVAGITVNQLNYCKCAAFTTLDLQEGSRHVPVPKH